MVSTVQRKKARQNTNRRKPVSPGILPFRRQHGGRRAGAGRKPKHGQAGVAHVARAPLAARFPAHVTLKLQRGLPRLRNRREYTALRAAFHVRGLEAIARPVADARTWMLTIGWRRHGLLSVHEMPA